MNFWRFVVRIIQYYTKRAEFRCKPQFYIFISLINLYKQFFKSLFGLKAVVQISANRFCRYFGVVAFHNQTYVDKLRLQKRFLTLFWPACIFYFFRTWLESRKNVKKHFFFKPYLDPQKIFFWKFFSIIRFLEW